MNFGQRIPRNVFSFAKFLLIFLACPTLAHAQNTYFLPGDAFFHAIATEHSLQDLPEEENVRWIFDYSIEGGYEPAFCGYAGYSKAKFTSLEKQFLKNLKEVYARIRKFSPRELREIDSDGVESLVEINGIHVFFYHQDFDIHRFQIGLQYNQNWVKETARFGYVAERAKLCCFIEGEEKVVVESWRNCKAVRALEVEVPDVAIEMGKLIESPVEFRHPIKAIVLPRWRLTRFYSRENGVPLYVVTNDGIESYYSDEGVWRKE